MGLSRETKGEMPLFSTKPEASSTWGRDLPVRPSCYWQIRKRDLLLGFFLASCSDIKYSDKKKKANTTL